MMIRSSKLMLEPVVILLLFYSLTGCQVSPRAPVSSLNTPAAEQDLDGLSPDQAATLGSLEQVNGYPLYTMHYQGAYAYPLDSPGRFSVAAVFTDRGPSWGCSLFAALYDPQSLLYGRNFDWEYSPALLLFTDPPDGYASVSMVDIAYLGYAGSRAVDLADAPLRDLRDLLDAPALPFDGMNERGLAVGMAAVPAGDMIPDPHKETIDSLMVIRMILDHAQNVDEAVTILGSYNLDWGSGPPLHYLVADVSGRSVLVEFYQGEMVTIYNDQPWHLATNFLRASVGDSPEGQCWRYDKISQRMTETGGNLSTQEAMELLSVVSQDITQWSVVYNMSAGQVSVVMGREYEVVQQFSLSSP
jgi:hypothetical protein